jgi:hypothetical protein
MKISDFTCRSCGSIYEVAESTSAEGRANRAFGAVCGGLLESWKDRRMRAYRLVLSAEHKYPHIPAPPSPQ